MKTGKGERLFSQSKLAGDSIDCWHDRRRVLTDERSSRAVSAATASPARQASPAVSQASL